MWSVVGQELGVDDWYQFATIKKNLTNLKQEQLAGIHTKSNLGKQIRNLENQLRTLSSHHLLEQGKLLILMDGLDESATNRIRDNIYKQLREFSRDYPKNCFILTCRTQVMEVNLSGFDFLEVADFNSEQIRQFVQNWFVANRQTEAEANTFWKTIYHATIENPDLRELTVTPVSLSLMCLVLQDERGKMPTDRGWLYKKGIQLLLSQWNDEKDIGGWEVGTKVYRQLSVEDKEALLIEIAARKFENPKNFVLFEQEELVEQISQQIQLANTQEGVAVLKAIETQHGLLIERADKLWSFSHLTFQEYFTVQWLTKLPSQKLTKKIASPQWKKVVKQLVKSQQPADRLLRLIKQATDQLVTQEIAIQSFLCWLCQKSESIQTDYKIVVIRAFYYLITFNLFQPLNLELARTLAYGLDIDQASALDRARARALNQRHILKHSVHALDYDGALNRKHARALAQSLALDIALDLALDLDIVLDITFSQEQKHFLTRALDFSLSRSIASDLYSRLSQLKNELLTPKTSTEAQILSWWLSDGTQWINKLRQIMIEYRNIGHNWQFTQEQQEQLQRYYEANKFLVDLMKIEGAVSEECRIEIEDGLLLPWAELQNRQPHLYGELEG